MSIPQSWQGMPHNWPQLSTYIYAGGSSPASELQSYWLGSGTLPLLAYCARYRKNALYVRRTAYLLTGTVRVEFRIDVLNYWSYEAVVKVFLGLLLNCALLGL